MENEFRMLPHELLFESKTNPRRHFDKVGLAELTESVKARGVLVPLLVRAGEQGGVHGYEVVAGARRFRAAKAALLAEVPARVVELSDDEVLEVQVIENLQREDVHPMDEALGYQALMKRPGYDADVLASKVGKSRSYIYASLKLCDLTKVAQKVFLDGKLNRSTALLVARMPHDLQAKAVEPITDQDMSVRQASEFIQEDFMRRLGTAPFPVADAELLPAAGACGSCPKRTGNQRELFGDVKSADVCTDPGCFQKKSELYVARRLEEAKAQGSKVLEPAQAKKLIPYGYQGPDTYMPQSSMVLLESRCREDPKNRTYKQLLGKDVDPAAITVAVTGDGDMVELVDKKAAAKLLKEAGHDLTPLRSTSGVSDYSREQRERAARAQRETRIRHLILRAVQDKAPASLGVEEMRIVAHGFVQEVWNENRKRLLDLWGAQGEASGAKARGVSGHADTQLDKVIDGLDQAALCRFLLTAAVVRDCYQGPYDNSKPLRLLALAKRLKVDPEKIRRDEVAAAAARKKAKVAPAVKPKAKGPLARKKSGKARKAA